MPSEKHRSRKHQNSNSSTSIHFADSIDQSAQHNQHSSTAVYALLDSGSTSSFLTKNIAEKLKLTPKPTTTLKIKGFNVTQTINSTVVDLQLSDIGSRATHQWRNVYVVDNDQLPTVKEHPKQIAYKFGHLRDIQMPQLSNLNVEALLGCNMYALIIAKEIQEGNTEQPFAVRSRLGLDSRWTESAFYTNEWCLLLTFAKHVKNTNNNDLKMSKVGGTWNLMDPEHQPETQRLTTKTKHLKYSQTLAAKQMTDDSKQGSSASQLSNCQTVAFTPTTIWCPYRGNSKTTMN